MASYLDRYLNENGEVVMPKPRFAYGQKVLVINNDEIQIREVCGIIYNLVYSNPVFYMFNAVGRNISEDEVFGSPSELCDAINSAFGHDVSGKLTGEWRREHLRCD